jgi:hypothetical protein
LRECRKQVEIEWKRGFWQEKRQELTQQAPQMKITDVDPTCSDAVASFQQPPKYDRGLTNRTAAEKNNPLECSE